VGVNVDGKDSLGSEITQKMKIDIDVFRSCGREIPGGVRLKSRLGCQ